MAEINLADICVVGGGSGRQNVSAEAVQMGHFLNHYSAQFPPEKSIVEGLVKYVLFKNHVENSVSDLPTDIAIL